MGSALRYRARATCGRTGVSKSAGNFLFLSFYTALSMYPYGEYPSNTVRVVASLKIFIYTLQNGRFSEAAHKARVACEAGGSGASCEAVEAVRTYAARCRSFAPFSRAR